LYVKKKAPDYRACTSKMAILPNLCVCPACPMECPLSYIPSGWNAKLIPLGSCKRPILSFKSLIMN
jgi:hypothetical protein